MLISGKSGIYVVDLVPLIQGIPQINHLSGVVDFYPKVNINRLLNQVIE